MLPIKGGINMAHWLWVLIVVLDIVAIVSLLAGRAGVAHKILWTLLILFLPVIGMIAYYLFGRSIRDA